MRNNKVMAQDCSTFYNSTASCLQEESKAVEKDKPPLTPFCRDEPRCPSTPPLPGPLTPVGACYRDDFCIQNHT